MINFNFVTLIYYGVENPNALGSINIMFFIGQNSKGIDKTLSIPFDNS